MTPRPGQQLFLAHAQPPSHSKTIIIVKEECQGIEYQANCLATPKEGWPPDVLHQQKLCLRKQKV